MEYILSIIGFPETSLKRAFAPLGHFVLHIYDHFIPHARNNYHPHLLSHRSLGLISSLLVAVKIFGLAVIAIGPVAPAFSSAITAENIINLTNQSRQEYKLQGLVENSMLDKAAQAKANDMLAKSYFAHNTPDGHTPWDFIVAEGYTYLMAGENLAVNFTEAENVETAWMNSPGHKANILNKNFEEIGIGIAQGEYQGHTAIFVVQEFGTPAAQKVALTEEPTPVQTADVPAPKIPFVAPAKVVGQTLGDKQYKPAVAPDTAPVLVAVKESPVVQASPEAPLPPTEVAIVHGEVKLDMDNVVINTQVDGPAVKVIAYFGQEAVMLKPINQNTWSGQLPIASLARGSAAVKIKAFGSDGQMNQISLADFAVDTVQNYYPAQVATDPKVNFFGKIFSPKTFEARFYLYVMATLLSGLILAVSIKRHIQHVSLIANSSFVVIFAALLYMVR